jgi:hypothetical protein
MIDNSLQEIADEQGWTGHTLLSLVSTFLQEHGHLDACVAYVSNIADEENEEEEEA